MMAAVYTRKLNSGEGLVISVNPLSVFEREEIRAGVERGETDQMISDRLGRHRCTINAEINRNHGRLNYSTVSAQQVAVAKRSRPKVPRFVIDPELAGHVTARLVAKYSPMTISIEMARNVHGFSAQVSHETIYQAVYVHGQRSLRRGLHTGLYRRTRCGRHRLIGPPTPTKSPLGAFTPTAQRPLIVGQRSEVGHFEGDLTLRAV